MESSKNKPVASFALKVAHVPDVNQVPWLMRQPRCCWSSPV